MTKAGTVANSWKRINRWIKENVPGWKPLKKGATEEQIANAEKRLGFKLPADLRASYRAHNGSGSEQLFPCPGEISYCLMPLSELAGDWKMQKELLGSGDFDRRPEKVDKGIRKEWWNINWIPFASDGGGDLFCVDLDPAPGGNVGQVITSNHETGRHRLLAPSFREWLWKLANDLEDGKLRYDADEGIVQSDRG